MTPPPRVAHTQCVVDDKIFVFGGRQGRLNNTKIVENILILITPNMSEVCKVYLPEM